MFRQRCEILQYSPQRPARAGEGNERVRRKDLTVLFIVYVSIFLFRSLTDGSLIFLSGATGTDAISIHGMLKCLQGHWLQELSP